MDGTGPGFERRARAGPRLKPFHEFQAQALDRPLNLLNKMLRFLGPFPKVGLRPTPSLGPSSEVRLRAFQKSQASGWVELLPGPITNPDDRHCDPDAHGDGDKNNDVE